MIKLAHIAPTAYTADAIRDSEFNMVLAHIADKDDTYAQLFKDSDKPTLLDNGAFELGVPYEAERMIDIGQRVGADIMVLPDYPFEHWGKGWDTIEDDIQMYKSNGFKTMFVPQSVKGDSEGYMLSLKAAVGHPDIDYIGLSILGAPNAYPDTPSYKVRERILHEISIKSYINKRFHILGMLDSVDEIKRLTYYSKLINSWDTSAAYWYGIHGMTVEGRTEKFKKAVEFDKLTGHDNRYDLIRSNVEYMKGLR